MERQLTLISLFSALIAILGLVPRIDLISGVPITAQSMGVMIAGAVLGPRRGALSVLLFLLLVALGLPLLAGGRGGLGAFASPTAGFLVGFPVAAFMTGWVVEHWRAFLLPTVFVGAAIGGIGVLYGFGIVGMAIVLNKTLLEATLLAVPFIAGDLIKAALTAFIVQSLFRARPSIIMSRVVR